MIYDVQIQQCVADIEACDTIEELRTTLDRIAQAYGYSSFGFVDAGRIGRGEKPTYIGTGGPRWEQEYVRNGFASVDPCLRRARRTNVPFTWSDVPLPEKVGRRTPGAVKTMEAAHDHGFRDGLVVPFHFRDGSGLYHSTSAVFFWPEKPRLLTRLLKSHKGDLHLIMLYWAQRALELIAKQSSAEPLSGLPPGADFGLTDREREVVTWAAAGLTVADTAEKLHLSVDTIETHVRNAVRKMGANNKTHAAALGVYYGIVDL